MLFRSAEFAQSSNYLQLVHDEMKEHAEFHIAVITAVRKVRADGTLDFCLERLAREMEECQEMMATK